MKGYEIRRILYQYSNDELCEIYNNLNHWKWDERLGEIPNGFYDLPNFLKRPYGECKQRYISPFMREIERVVSQHDLLRYHHICNLERTEEEFEQWWRNEGAEFAVMIQPPEQIVSVENSTILLSVVSSIVASMVVVLMLFILFQ